MLSFIVLIHYIGDLISSHLCVALQPKPPDVQMRLKEEDKLSYSKSEPQSRPDNLDGEEPVAPIETDNVSILKLDSVTLAGHPGGSTHQLEAPKQNEFHQHLANDIVITRSGDLSETLLIAKETHRVGEAYDDGDVASDASDIPTKKPEQNEDDVTGDVITAVEASSEMSQNWRRGDRRGRGGRGRGHGRVHLNTPSSSSRQHSNVETDLSYLESQIERTHIQDKSLPQVKVPQGQANATSSPPSTPSFSREMWETNNFPFLVDEATISFMKESKTLFLMRGLPGSGKSTTVKMIAHVYPSAVSCSADDYFLQSDGSYRFDRTQLSNAHEFCQENTRVACAQGTPIVIIDNTNVKVWEMKKYIGIAQQYGYTVITVEPKTSWRFRPQELARRNKHGVDVETIRQRLSQYDSVVPLFFGWFLDAYASRDVVNRSEDIFQFCQDISPDFSYFLSTLTFNQAENNIRLGSIYTRGRGPQPSLHCTTFFSNRGRASSALEYQSSPTVQNALGSVTDVEIVGFVFTAQTAGARLKFKDKDLELWRKDDDEGRSDSEDRRNWRRGRGGASNSSSARSSNRFQSLLDEWPSDGQEEEAASCQKVSKFRPVVGIGSRAHLTLGFTTDTKAVQTGLDLVQVVELEGRADYSDESWKIPGGVLRCYRGQYWVVYLDKPLQTNAVFTGRY